MDSRDSLKLLRIGTLTSVQQQSRSSEFHFHTITSLTRKMIELGNMSRAGILVKLLDNYEDYQYDYDKLTITSGVSGKP